MSAHQTEPNDPYFKGTSPATYRYQWGLHNISQSPPAGIYDSDIDAAEVWDLSTGSTDVIIAILDSGIPMLNGTLSHPDLDDQNKIILGPDYVDDPNSPEGQEGVRDRRGHGTHVAGIVAAETNNSGGVAGVAWNCKLMIIQVFNSSGNGTDLTFYNGVHYAVDYKRNNPGKRVVINFSGGGGSPTSNLQAAVEYANTYGVAIIASTGNDDPTIRYPAAYSTSFSNVIAVGATDQNDVRSPYSDYGPQINVVAPGGYGDSFDSNDIFSTTPNYAFTLESYGVGRTYGYLAGTSMAAPFVSGAVALILSVNPNLSPSQIRNTLQQTADDKGSAGFDNYYGYGRINTAKAVAKAYSLSHTNYTLNIGTAPLHQYDSDFDMVFEVSPCPGVSAGRYIVDRHYIDITLDGFTSTPYGWYTAPYGYSWSNPNNCSRYLNRTTTSSSIRFRTVFYWIKRVYPNGSTINKWAPFNPNSSVLREYVTLGIIPQLSVSINGQSSADPYTTSNFTSTVTGAQGNVTYQWEQMYPCCADGPNCDVYFLRGNNSTLSVYNLIYHYYLRLTVWDGLGRSAVDYHYVTVQTCAGGGGGSGCPTLAFESDSLSDSGLEDENPLLITSTSNPTEDVVDYYLIQSEIAPIHGEIHFTIYEPQTEHTWLDVVEMIEVETNQDEFVAVTDNGEVVNYIEPAYPVTIMLNDSIDVSEVLSAPDESTLDIASGDVLSIEITGGQGDINSNNLFIILEGLIVAKNITADVMFIPEGSEDQDLGDIFLRPNISVASLSLGSLGEGILQVIFHQEGTMDYLTLVNDLNSANIETLEMTSAIHNEEGSVLELLVGDPDQQYAEIFPGQEIAFAFREGTHSLPKIDYILKTVGRYETDTTDSYQMLAKTTEEVIIPKENKLYDNYPNPFNPTTLIKYSVKENGLVTLKVYDVLGKEIITLVNEGKDAGIYTVNFDGSNLSSGIYFYSISARDFVQTKKMMILK